MGYRISYIRDLNGMVKHSFGKNRQLKKKFGILAIVAGILISGGILKLKSVQDFLLPGDGNITRAAISTMIQDFKDGKTITESVQTFCRELIENEDLS